MASSVSANTTTDNITTWAQQGILSLQNQITDETDPINAFKTFKIANSIHKPRKSMYFQPVQNGSADPSTAHESNQPIDALLVCSPCMSRGQSQYAFPSILRRLLASL